MTHYISLISCMISWRLLLIGFYSSGEVYKSPCLSCTLATQKMNELKWANNWAKSYLREKFGGLLSTKVTCFWIMSGEFLLRRKMLNIILIEKYNFTLHSIQPLYTTNLYNHSMQPFYITYRFIIIHLLICYLLISVFNPLLTSYYVLTTRISMFYPPSRNLHYGNFFHVSRILGTNIR